MSSNDGPSLEVPVPSRITTVLLPILSNCSTVFWFEFTSSTTFSSVSLPPPITVATAARAAPIIRVPIVPLPLSSLTLFGIAILMEGDSASTCSTCTKRLELSAFSTLLLSMVGMEFDDDPISIRPCGALFSMTGATTSSTLQVMLLSPLSSPTTVSSSLFNCSTKPLFSPRLKFHASSMSSLDQSLHGAGEYE